MSVEIVIKIKKDFKNVPSDSNPFSFFRHRAGCYDTNIARWKTRYRQSHYKYLFDQY